MNRVAQWVLIGAAVVAIVVAARSGPDTGLRPPSRRQPMAEFRVPAIGGPEWALSEQRGSVVLLNFWATWCGPCRKETPEMVTLAQTYGPRGLRVAGISMDDDPGAVVPEFVARYRVPYPMLTPNQTLPIANTIAALPTTLLLDRHGRVARTYRGARDAEDMAPDIEKLLAEN